MNPICVIRLATRHDVNALSRLEEGASDGWSSSHFEGGLRHPHGWMYVAFASSEEDIIGYICGHAVLDEAEIHKIRVADGWRTRGVGSGLLCHVLHRLKGSEIRECFLEVRKSNSAAILFYRKHGFQLVANRKGYYADPIEDALVMSRPLANIAASQAEGKSGKNHDYFMSFTTQQKGEETIEEHQKLRHQGKKGAHPGRFQRAPGRAEQHHGRHTDQGGTAHHQPLP